MLCMLPFISYAQSASEIQSQIDANNAEIEKLDKEIAQYQAQLDATTKQKNTLQNTLSQLDLQRKKLTASINVTKSQINTTQLQIQKLSGNIRDAQTSIDNNRAGLAESIRTLNDMDKQPLAVTLLGSDNISDAWNDIDAIATLQDAVHDDIEDLAQQKKTLTDSKTAAEEKKAQLSRQQATLLTQQGSLDATRKAQSDLLAQTKSQESTYQQILAQKRAQQDALEAALSNLKAQYNVAVNPDDVPKGGKGILRYPLDNVRITQYFGNTPFAAAGAYGGKGHNGMDFAASIGTPIKASLTGTVAGTGNTDAIRGCYSFGKWVMIRHANGLSTMYAHLSQISVTTGQSVSTGQVIGYSGDTGYATGPHLHFGVYVSAVTKIIRLGEATNSTTPCSGAVMPVPPTSGYLNPLNYF